MVGITDKEIKNKAKETSGGNYYYEQGFVYGFELGEENGRKEVYKELEWVTDTDNYIASKLERLKELEKENKLKEEIIIGEQQEINQLEKEIAELKTHCKAVDEVNVKLRNCFNCKNNSSKTSVFCRFYVSCKNNEYWQLAEKE